LGEKGGRKRRSEVVQQSQKILLLAEWKKEGGGKKEGKEKRVQSRTPQARPALTFFPATKKEEGKGISLALQITGTNSGEKEREGKVTEQFSTTSNLAFSPQAGRRGRHFSSVETANCPNQSEGEKEREERKDKVTWHVVRHGPPRIRQKKGKRAGARLVMSSNPPTSGGKEGKEEERKKAPLPWPTYRPPGKASGGPLQFLPPLPSPEGKKDEEKKKGATAVLPLPSERRYTPLPHSRRNQMFEYLKKREERRERGERTRNSRPRLFKTVAFLG